MPTLEVLFFADGPVGADLQELSSGEANTGNLYRYDPIADQYIYNLSTRPLMPGTSYIVRTTLDDGSGHDVVISLK